MAARVAFTREAAQRIANAVRRVEKTPRDMAGENRPAPQETSFWAYLSSPGGQTGHFWSWVRAVPVEDLPNVNNGPVDITEVPPLWDFARPIMAGYLNAREANGNRQVQPGAIAKLEFAGYDGTGEPVYVFTYNTNPEELGVNLHDHRDNVVGGGFAFSVYHPGTALPQQPWAV